MKPQSTKRALLASALSILLCVAMLISSTFAWFTDSAQSGKNKIVAGNLDVELNWSVDGKNWQRVNKDTDMFKDTLWEPGYTQVVYLQVENVGSLALKYRFGINVADKVIGKTADNKEIDLSGFIEFGVVNSAEPYPATDAGRAAAREAVKTSAVPVSAGYSSVEDHLLPGEASDTIALVVYMPETVNNEANHGFGKQAPSIDLGINLVAAQYIEESDSFNKEYDKPAYYPGAIASASELSKALNNSETKQVVLGTDIKGRFSIKDEKTVDLNDNKISSDRGSNSILALTGSTLTVKDGVIEGFTGSVKAVDIAEGSTVTFENVSFIGNEGSVAVGVRAKAGFDTKLVFKNCTFENNQVCIQGRDGASNVDVIFDGCTFTGEYASGLSSLIDLSSNYISGNITITGCTFNYKAANKNNWRQNAISLGYFVVDGAEKNIEIKNCIFNLDELANAYDAPSNQHITVTEQDNTVNR